jgi:hypothetical protein
MAGGLAGGDVLGSIQRGCPQVAQQGRVGITPQRCEGAFAAILRSGHQGREGVADHRPEYRHQPRVSAANPVMPTAGIFP